MVFDSEQRGEIEAIAKRVNGEEQIDQRVSILTGSENPLVSLLCGAGYQKADLDGISHSGERDIYVLDEHLNQVLDWGATLPVFKDRSKTVDGVVELPVLANYNAQIAIANGTSVELHNLENTVNLSRSLAGVVPENIENRLAMKQIIKEDGYHPIKDDDSKLILPNGLNLVGIKYLDSSFEGKYGLLGHNPYAINASDFRVSLKGTLKFSYSLLVSSSKGGLFSLEGEVSKGINDPSESVVDGSGGLAITQAEAKEVDTSLKIPHSRLPHHIYRYFDFKVNTPGAINVSTQYVKKRDEAYQAWLLQEVQKLPIDAGVRGALGIDLDNHSPAYSGNEAIIELGKMAKERLGI